MCAVPVVEADQEAVQVLLAPGGNTGHELFRRFASFFGCDHDGRAMRIVGANKFHFVALHALVPHPDVGLDVFHDVANVEGAVGIGQGGGDKKLARHVAIIRAVKNMSPQRHAGTQE